MIVCPASVLAIGDFSPGSITIRPVELAPLPAAVDKVVERRWRREVELNPRLYPGAILSPAAVRVSAEGIEIDCGLSDFRQFMGTTWPEVPEHLRRRALGQLAVTVTGDDRLVVGVRSTDIDWGGFRHAVPAGRMQPHEGTPEEAMLLEFREETAIAPAEIVSLRCIGVLEDLTWGRQNYELVYLARVDCSATELVDRAAAAEHSFEHQRVEDYAWDRDTVSAILCNEPASFTPAGFAGIAVALRHAFGEDAFPDWEVRPVTYEDYTGKRPAPPPGFG